MLLTGSTVSHFKILDKLGEGGMGIVYKARDQLLDRLVAIKVLPSLTAATEERRHRFVLEAKSASALNHPNSAQDCAQISADVRKPEPYRCIQILEE